MFLPTFFKGWWEINKKKPHRQYKFLGCLNGWNFSTMKEYAKIKQIIVPFFSRGNIDFLFFHHHIFQDSRTFSPSQTTYPCFKWASFGILILNCPLLTNLPEHHPFIHCFTELQSLTLVMLLLTCDFLNGELFSRIHCYRSK